MLTLGVPVLTTIGGIAFLDQSLNGLQILGVVIVLVGLSLVIRREAQILGNR